MSDIILIDIALVIVIAAIVALVAKKFKQPHIPAYLLAGVVIGPGIAFLAKTGLLSGFGITESFSLIAEKEFIRTLSEFGIALLLFMVGLEINFSKFKEIVAKI